MVNILASKHMRNDMLRFIFFLCEEIFGNIDEQTVVLETLTSVQWQIQDFPQEALTLDPPLL